MSDRFGGGGGGGSAKWIAICLDTHCPVPLVWLYNVICNMLTC